MMLIKAISLDPSTFDALFRATTGQRVCITSRTVTVTLPDRNSTQYLQRVVTYWATPTDVYMALNGKAHRLFVDVSVDFGMGFKHIWLSDGPVNVVENLPSEEWPEILQPVE